MWRVNDLSLLRCSLLYGACLRIQCLRNVSGLFQLPLATESANWPEHGRLAVLLFADQNLALRQNHVI
jgi:hypothetical protein